MTETSFNGNFESNIRTAVETCIGLEKAIEHKKADKNADGRITYTIWYGDAKSGKDVKVYFIRGSNPFEGYGKISPIKLIGDEHGPLPVLAEDAIADTRVERLIEAVSMYRGALAYGN